MQRNRIVISLIVAVVVIVGLFITKPWTYFVVNEVDEAFPNLSNEERDAVKNMPEEQQDALIDMSKENPDMAKDTALAQMTETAPLDAETQAMPEDMPTEPIVISAGSFITIDAVHGAEGTATIYQLTDGSHVVRLEDFKSTNGPDLHVYLSKELPKDTFGDIGEGAIDLGSLKGNVGNQNYDIPADVNPDEFKSIVIYCVPFHVVFSSAELAIE